MRNVNEKDEPKDQVWLINPFGGEPWFCHIGTLDAVQDDVIAHRKTAYAGPEIVPRSTSLRVRVK